MADASHDATLLSWGPESLPGQHLHTPFLDATLSGLLACGPPSCVVLTGPVALPRLVQAAYGAYLQALGSGRDPSAVREALGEGADAAASPIPARSGELPPMTCCCPFPPWILNQRRWRATG